MGLKLKFLFPVLKYEENDRAVIQEVMIIADVLKWEGVKKVDI